MNTININPFHKFAIDSEGGASILIYYGINGNGDVIVDGGFTKCFLSMEEEGTFKYLQNLAAFTARIECNFNKVGLAKNIHYKVQGINKPIKTFTRIIFVIDCEVPYYLEDIEYKIKNSYSNGDIIYLLNSKEYKININDLNKGYNKLFEPDFSFDNNIILNEINNYENNLYRKIIIISVGEQTRDNIRLGDILFSRMKLNHCYYTIYSRYKTKKYFLEEIKKITNNIKDLISFNLNYKFLRNSLYSSYFNSEEEEKNSKEEIMNMLNNLTKDPNLKLEDDDEIKKAILMEMIKSTNVKTILPLAADKDSK